jgi:AMP phosphorylase
VNVLKSLVMDLTAGRRAVVLNDLDARGMSILLSDRLVVKHNSSTIVAIAEISHALVPKGSIGIYRDLAKTLGVATGDVVEIELAPLPRSIQFIKKKIGGETLTSEEISSIVQDVVSYNLSDLEIASFLFASHYKDMSMDETESLTRAMVATGDTLNLPGTVVDKHSIGGVPGNKISLLVVPIVAASGLMIPKTSSRAITSPSGTADTMSVLADVNFSLQEVEAIVTKHNGCIVWGGALNIAPADDIFIRVESPLRIDPRSQMLASIMAKKAAVGAKHMVLDVPAGRGAKVASVAEAERLATSFIELGRRLGIQVKCGVTYGGQPVGRAVGPALEAREALSALTDPNGVSKSLVLKSASIAGLLLESTGRAPKGGGLAAALEFMQKGTALKKLLDIIEAQGGKRTVKPDDIPLGCHVYKVTSPSDGYVTVVDNQGITDVARAAGAPQEKGAGVLLYAKQGYKVARGDLLFEVYAERSSKLSEAAAIAESRVPVLVEGMLLKEIPEF